MRVAVNPWNGILKMNDRGWTSAQVREALLLLTKEDCENTRMLWLFDNHMTYLPKEICVLFPNLEMLSIQGNFIQELPNELTRLTKLDTLLVSRNPISQLPASYGRLTTLEMLGLDDTRLPLHLRQVPKVHANKKTQELLQQVVKCNEELYAPVRKSIVILLGLRKRRDVLDFLSIDKGVITVIAKIIWAQKNTVSF